MKSGIVRVITLTTRRMDNSQLDSTVAHMRVRTLVVLSCRFSKNLKIHTDPLCLKDALWRRCATYHTFVNILTFLIIQMQVRMLELTFVIEFENCQSTNFKEDRCWTLMFCIFTVSRFHNKFEERSIRKISLLFQFWSYSAVFRVFHIWKYTSNSWRFFLFRCLNDVHKIP